MTNVIDGPGRYKTREGKIVHVTEIDERYNMPVQCAPFSRRTLEGRYTFSDKDDPRDIVEKLPDADECDCARYELMVCDTCQKASVPSFDAPTAEASDGKQYPVELWLKAQPLDSPYLFDFADIVIWDKMVPISHVIYHDRYEWPDICTGWTFSPTPPPPKPKEEVNIWDEYLNDSGSFLVPVGAGIFRFPVSPEFVGRNSRIFSALAAYINHILSQEKG